MDNIGTYSKIDIIKDKLIVFYNAFFFSSLFLICVMKDKFGNVLKIGDTIIVTVSKGSVYLTTAEILGFDESTGKVFISYVSTPKEKWVDFTKEPCMLYPEPERKLYPEVGLFKDNTGIKVNIGDTVAYKLGENIGIGKIQSIESDLWGTLENGMKVRNTQIIVLNV